MRLPWVSPRTGLLMAGLFSSIYAQNNDDTTSDTNDATTGETTAQTTGKTTAQTTAKTTAKTTAQTTADTSDNTDTSENTDTTKATNTANTDTGTTKTQTEDSNSDSSQATTTKKVQSSTLTITGGTTENSATGSTPLPTIAKITAVNSLNADSSQASMPGLSLAMPTLSSTGVPIPTVTVPPMDNNPYLATSNLPEGTVFIAVGAIFGGIALAVIAWRIASALALRRSLKRTETSGFMATGQADRKALLHPEIINRSPADFYSGGPSGAGSGAYTSTDHLGSLGAGSNNPTMTSVPGSSLFFSPTAEVMHSRNDNTNSMISTSGNPRASVYLPAGYYSASGSRDPAPGNGSMRNYSMMRDSMVRNSMAPDSLTRDRDSVARDSVYAQSVRPSSFHDPQDGQGGGPQPRPHSVAQQSQRAPSAYLDDLLGHDGH